MMFTEYLFSQRSDILDKTKALEHNLQKNMNKRLDGLIFKAVASESAFNAGKPHAENVISLVQVGNSEINIYKGDTRILIDGGGGANHGLLINRISP